MAQLRLSLFGAFQATVNETRLTKFRSAKNQALLAFLAVEAHRAYARSTLADLLWPDDRQESARQNLRQAIFQLRHLLESEADTPASFLLVTPSTVQFNPDSNHWVDVVHFERLLDACARHEHHDPVTCAVCLHRLAQAVDLYRGPLLEDIFVEQSHRMEEWISLRRETLHQQVLSALYTLSAGQIALGDASSAYRYAQRQIELDPLREEAYRQGMIALAMRGEFSAASALYLDASRRLYEELGVSPSLETETIFQQISRGEAPRPSIKINVAPRHNLPAPLTPFIGREQEVARVTERLLDPACRQLTLIGIGGVGKTRLALQSAAAVTAAFAEGVWFVSLAGVQAEADLVTAIITVLGLTPPKGDATRFLFDYLAGRDLLLLLDNFEHLIHGAGLVTELLERAGGLKILATSRERLNLQAESLFVVDPLPTPSSDEARGQADLRTFSSIKLFAERAGRSLLGFKLGDENLPAVTAICRQVDGLPLAIELAATWVDQFTCAEIADAIAASRDFLASAKTEIEPRQRSLRAVFSHSWGLLTEAEQAALASISVFQGAFGREAALRVAQTDLTTLSALTHKSLLRLVGAGRYAAHEVIRQFAAEALHAYFDAAAVHRRHSDYYLNFMAARGQILWGDENEVGARQIQAEIDNIRAAWRWAAQHKTTTSLLEALPALMRYSIGAGLYRETSALLQAALDPLIDEREDRHFAATASRLHNEQARLLHHLSDYPASAAAARTALTLAESLADLPLQAAALRTLADARYQQGERAEARETMSAALRLAQSVAAPELEADCQLGYGDILMYAGDPAVDDAHRRALDLYRQWGDRCGEAWTLNSMGIAAAFQKRYDDGQRFFRDAVAIFQRLGDRPSTGRALNNLAAIYVLQQEYAASEPILSQSLQLSRQNGYRLGEVQTLTNLTEALRGQGKRDEARRCCDEALRLSRILGHIRGEGMQLKILGEMAGEEGDYATAVACFEQALVAARTQGDRYYEGERLYALGQALRHLGDAQSALARLHEALAIARQVNDKSTEERVWAELELLSAQQKPPAS